jgi:hypothetical protein
LRHTHRDRGLWCLLLAGVALAASLGVMVLSANARGAGQPLAAAGSYALVDTWQDRPWQLTAGAYEGPLDVTDAPDGRRWVLDQRRFGVGTFVHVFDAAGLPQGVYAVRGAPDHIDADASGRIYAIETLRPADVGRSCAVTGYEGDGRVVTAFAFPIPAWAVCLDLGAGPDGRLYVSVSQQPDVPAPAGAETPSRVEVFDGTGQPVDRVDAEEFFAVDHSDPTHVHPIFNALDVGRDGNIYVGLTFAGCT